MIYAFGNGGESLQDAGLFEAKDDTDARATALHYGRLFGIRGARILKGWTQDELAEERIRRWKEAGE